MIKQKTGFLAVGAYGGNQTLPFYKENYPCLFVNTALPDLNSLIEVNEKYKYHIPGGEGCNKNRQKSKEILRKDMENLIVEIKDKLGSVEILFIVGSAGGGTASGMLASLKRIISNELNLKACIIVTVLPDTKTESVKALLNCYETLAEIEQLDEPGCTFILDNDKNMNKMRINEMFFCYLNALLTNDSSSVLGNVDDAEVEEMPSTTGVAIISKLGKDKSDTQQLLSTFRNNIYAPVEQDGVIKYLGLIHADKGRNIQMADIYSAIGTPLDSFIGYEAEATICMLAGLSLPYTKMDEIKGIIDNNKDVIKRNLSAPRTSRLNSDFGFLEAEVVHSKPTEKKRSNRDLLF